MIVGLDLGTIGIRLSSYVQGKPRELTAPDGGAEFPLAVARKKDGTRLTGARAAAVLLTEPGRGIAGIKRFLGQRDPLPFRWTTPFPVETSKRDTAKLLLDGEEIRLETLLAEILREILDHVRRQTGEEIDTLIASVPDHFSHNQRQSLLLALELAGTPAKHLLDDSLAALLALQDRRITGRRGIVVSMGAAYASLAVVSSQGAVVETLSCLPLSGAAGEDIDWALAGLLQQKFREAFKGPVAEVPEVTVRMLQAARSVREKLSSAAAASFDLPYLMAKTLGPRNFSGTVSQEELAKIQAPASLSLRETVQKALSESRSTTGMIAAAILVGGAARAPYVQETFEGMGIPVTKAVGNVLLPAKGAAMYGAAQAGLIKTIRAFEVTNSSVFVMLPTKQLRMAIPRGSPRPVREEFVVRPGVERWPSHMVMLLQGQESPTGPPPLLGTFPLTALTGARDVNLTLNFAVSEDHYGIVRLHLLDQDQRVDKVVESIEDAYRRRKPGQDPAELPVGSVLAERFEVERQIGAGGFSFIYQVKNLETGKHEALKILRTKYNLDGVVLERFRRSAEQILRINHPNIARVLEFLFYDGMYIIHMEFIEGQDLEHYLESPDCKSLSVPQRVELLCGILEALRDLRGYDILHADLKPQNIMIGRGRQPKLIDFELSKFLKLPPLADEEVTGTPKYFSPEHLAGKQYFGEYSDIYSLGLIGYLLLCGQFPKKEHKPAADYILSILELGKDIRPIHPSKVSRAVPKKLGDVIVKSILMSRNERYQTFDDMLDDLREFRE